MYNVEIKITKNTKATMKGKPVSGGIAIKLGPPKGKAPSPVGGERGSPDKNNKMCVISLATPRY